jgi:chromosomal replication initiator protein
MTEHSELARQKRHYCAVRERLTHAAASVGRSARIERLERQLAELTSDGAAKARRIAALEADLADAEARLLAQAQALLSGRGADVPDDDSEGDRPTIEEIVAAVLTDFPGVSWEDVVSVRRERRLVKPRHACMRAVYERRGDLSLSRIGRIFRRDHTTVLEAVRKPDIEGERGRHA